MFAHKEVIVPYQLHAWPATDIEEEEDDRPTDEGTLLEDARGAELGTADELVRGALELATVEGVLEVTTELHTAPVIAGTCALPAPLVPWIPNSTLALTAILLFQFSGVAV